MVARSGIPRLAKKEQHILLQSLLPKQSMKLLLRSCIFAEDSNSVDRKDYVKALEPIRCDL